MSERPWENLGLRNNAEALPKTVAVFEKAAAAPKASTGVGAESAFGSE